MRYGTSQVVIETIPTGIRVTVERRVGKPTEMILEGDHGPQLVTNLLRAIEPHFPLDQQGGPISVIMTAKGFAWQVGLGVDPSAPVGLTLRPPEIPGFHYLLEPDRARAIGRALIEMADKAEAGSNAKN